MTDSQPTPVDSTATDVSIEVKTEAKQELPAAEVETPAIPPVEEAADQPTDSNLTESNGHELKAEEVKAEEPKIEEPETSGPTIKEAEQQQEQPKDGEMSEVASKPEGPIDENGRHYARLRGLPYSATGDDIRKFFGGQIEITDLFFLNNLDGKPNGEAYIRLATYEDLERALEKHRNSFGTRYIEVFQLGEVEIDSALKRMEKRDNAEFATIRVRGLPFSCKREDLIGFFKSLSVAEVIFGKEAGDWGRPTGEAYVRFNSKSDAEEAMQLNGQYLGRRYLELFHVDNDAFESFKQRMNAPAGPRPRPLAEVGEDPWGYYPRPQNSGPGLSSANAQLPAPYQPPYNYDPYAYEAPPTAQMPPRASRNLYAQPTVPQYAQPSMPAQPQGRYPPTPYGGGHQQYPPPQRHTGWGAPAARGYDYAPDPYARSAYGGGPMGGGASGGFGGTEQITPNKIHMRGLPYRVTPQQIEEFFAPLPLVEIKIGLYQDGRASGDGIVEFATPLDANEAMKRDRNSIKNRYIELFPFDQMKLGTGTSYKTISGGYRGSTMPSAAPSMGAPQMPIGGYY